MNQRIFPPSCGRRAAVLGIVSACALHLAACEASSESYGIRAWGEAFVEEGIPASEVSDGWAIEFDEFVIAIGDVSVHAEQRVDIDGWYVFDLTAPTDGAGQALTEVSVAGPMTRVDYWLGRVRGDVVGGNATLAQVDALVAGGYALSVRGRACKGAEEIGFAWDFPMEYGHSCELGQPAATPMSGGPTLTLHADHLLLDDLEHEPRIAFDAIAQADRDGDGDGVAAVAELAAVDITAMERYQSGNNELRDLWSYIGTLAGTQGHVDGEGDCAPRYVPRDDIGLGESGPHDAGAAVYATHCASCHGATGSGDGAAAPGWPRPTDLTRLGPLALDPDYLLYRIRNGGAFFPYASAMPAYDDALSEADERALIGHLLRWSHD